MQTFDLVADPDPGVPAAQVLHMTRGGQPAGLDGPPGGGEDLGGQVPSVGALTGRAVGLADEDVRAVGDQSHSAGTASVSRPSSGATAGVVCTPSIDIGRPGAG